MMDFALIAVTIPHVNAALHPGQAPAAEQAVLSEIGFIVRPRPEWPS
jgi:hypothetical protein